jgi:hypothetical protein
MPRWIDNVFLYSLAIPFSNYSDTQTLELIVRVFHHRSPEVAGHGFCDTIVHLLRADSVAAWVERSDYEKRGTRRCV